MLILHVSYRCRGRIAVNNPFCWKSQQTREQIKSFSVITCQSSKDMNWLHEREPVVLESSDEILQWLDHHQYPLDTALKMLKSRDGVLGYHPADRSLVNYPQQYKSIECIMPHEDESNDKKPNKLGVVPKGQPRIDAFFKQKGTPLKISSSSASKTKLESVKKIDADDDEKKSGYDAGDYGQDKADDDEDIVEVGRVYKRTSAKAFGDDDDANNQSSKKVPEREAAKPENSA